MRESTVEKYLHTEVEKAGGTTRKFKSPGRKNVPDRIVIWPVRRLTARVCIAPESAAVHFIECKAPGKKARKAQAREHNRLMLLGCVVLVIDTKDKVKCYIERYK